VLSNITRDGGENSGSRNDNFENLNDHEVSKINDSVSTTVRDSDKMDGIGPYHLDLGTNFFYSLFFIIYIFNALINCWSFSL
jgi:hypothetical protein